MTNTPTSFPAYCVLCKHEWTAGFPDGIDPEARFLLECPECGAGLGRPKSWDGCEWNPEEGRAAYDADKHYRKNRATVIVGADGDWRLCASCAELPEFKRFRRRKRIDG